MEASSKKGEKLDHLLASAARLMSEQGYAQTTIRDVARETGYSLAGMYYYFENKEDLLYQIQQRTFSSLLGEQEEAVRVGSAEDKLRRLLENYLSYFSRHSNELKVCTYEMQTLGAERYETIADLRKRYFRCVARVVGEIMGGEEADSAAVRRHTLFIFGMMNWIFMWYEPDRDGDVKSLGEEMIKLILQGLPSEK